MKLKREKWGFFNKQSVELFTIWDKKTGFFVEISDFGATIVRLKIPDRKGNVKDVIFGQNSPDDYVKYGGYLGATIGRTANRISDSKFNLECKQYELFANDGKHSLHGGKNGFSYKVWKCLTTEISPSGDNVRLIFEYISPDGEEGYPGTLNTKLTYLISPMRLEWVFEAKTDKTTIVNLTNHSYWNLNGLDATIDTLELSVNADYYMPVDETLIPTGEIKEVGNTGLDFRKLKKLSAIFKNAEEIDHNFILNEYDQGNKKPRFVAELYSKKNGISMKVFTTEPGLQIYTGNFMEKIISFGNQCKKHSAICLENQRFPNAINMPKYADSVILKPNMKYFHNTIHEFSVK
ncbi:MAG: aldose epimerase family protein [Promethearchaeota archaeon]